MQQVLAGTAKQQVTIERMTEHDLLEVVQIEQASGLSHWGWDAYYQELQSPESIMLVARSTKGTRSVAGFIVARQMVDELHINNVAVRLNHRGRGIAEELLRGVLSWGRGKSAVQAILEVRAGNTAAQALYRKCGFELIGHRHQYYREPVEDALLMAVSLKKKP